ncbi:caspase family protein [Kitasatospora sp. NPDC057542]|uniref:caspase family protein n=1 Tax=Kitasatospora sp. NPDC057542 TaxID=3346162 RepID=UPI0036933DEA
MRYLIAAGTSTYSAGELPYLAHALDDVERVAEFLTSPEMGYTRVLAEVSRDPVSADFEDALSDWCTSGELTAEDVVVVYYAGHGEQPNPGAPYRLACADSRFSRPRSWLSPQNMAEILAASPLRNVLFVIDSCHAAHGSTEIQVMTDGIVASRPRGDDNGAGTWVLASARHRDLADDGAFVSGFIEVCAAGDGPSQRYLSPSAVAAKVNQAFLAAGARQRAACSSNHQGAQPPFFPNPGYDPSAEVGEREETGDSSDLSSHFEPRGRGVEHVHDPGSYFTGRRTALNQLYDAMNGQGGQGALVVTASPGSGKSAVLGRLVLEGHSDASANARHQSLEALVTRLAAAADVRATDPAALLTALAKRQAPLRVVIDSLDEAGPAGDRAEARRIAWDLLRPLGAVPCVRLVVGSRRELLPHIGEQVNSIDLDSAEYADDTSTAEYVRRILGDAGSPYAGLEERIGVIAAEVARRAGHCFLVARMTASALLRGELLDTTVPGWAEILPSDVGGAFEAYLRRIPQHRAEAVMALLTALAFGEGHGLPRRIWLLVASRLSGIPLREADIDALVEEDGSYLTWAEVSGTKHFRLYHQELTDYLRQRALKVRDLQDVQEGFVEVLLDLTPGRTWAQALPYVRQHLATHAAAAGSIQGLVEDPAFVLAADPTGLLPAVRHHSCDPVLAMVVERFVGLVGPPDTDRAALLTFAAESNGAMAFARRTEELSSSVQRVRIEARPVTPHRIVGRHHERTYSTTAMTGRWQIDDLVLPDKDRVVLAVALGQSDVYVWMIDTPAASATLLHPSRIRGMRALPAHTGHPLAVTLDDLGDLRLWNVSDQTVVHHIRGERFDEILDAGELKNGTSVVVCRSEDHVVVIDSSGRTLLKEPFTSKGPNNSTTAALVWHGNGTPHLVVCDFEGGKVIAYAADEGWRRNVLLSNLRKPKLLNRSTRKLGSALVAIWEPGRRPGSPGCVKILDCGSAQIVAADRNSHTQPRGKFVRLKSRDVAFVASSWEDTIIYSTGTGQVTRAGTDVDIHSLFTPLTPASASGTYAVGASFGGSVNIVDCENGSSAGRALHGHEGTVCGLHTLASLDAHSQDVLTVSNDGTARLWHVLFDDHRVERFAEDDQGGTGDKATTVLIHGWSARSREFVVGSWHGLRLVDNDALDHSTHTPLVAHHLTDTHMSELGTQTEGEDGTLNLLGKIEEIIDTAEESHAKAIFSWQQLHADGTIECTRPETLAMTPWETSCHLIPPTLQHPGTRLVGFDPENGHIFAATSPKAQVGIDIAPWDIDIDSTMVFTAGFSDPSGHAMLLVAVRQAATSGDFTASGYYTHEDLPGADAASRGYLWDTTSRQPVHGKPIILPDRIKSLVPHHGDCGTRYVAMAGADGRAAVLDLECGEIHAVHSDRQVTGRRTLRNATNGHGYYLRWADTQTGKPVLAYMAGLGRDDTVLSPVVIWDSAHPGAPARELPVRARRLLWTGLAPSGDSLLAISDEFGIRLFTLPDAEEVWSTPLPALVTSLAARPHSPHLDLGVATQQGVVLIRPRLTPYWQRRLLQKP